MSKRHDYDNYATPKWCYELLKPFIDWSKVNSTLEPCEGDGRITRWMQETSTTTFYEIRNGTDYLSLPRNNYDLIVTNPPYSKAMEFVKKGISESICSFWLLRLGFLASQKRRGFFKENPIAALIVLSRRPSFTDNSRTDSSEYAWFVWDKDSICKVRGIIHV